jgi:hypothetical protein
MSRKNRRNAGGAQPAKQTPASQTMPTPTTSETSSNSALPTALASGTPAAPSPPLPLDGDKVARPPIIPDDPVRRAALSETCQMFRQFLTMRYYTLTGCAIINAALFALYFNYQTLDWVQNWLIRIIGGIIAIACIGIENRIAYLIDFYEKEMNRYAKELGINDMIARDKFRWKHITVVSGLSMTIYLAVAVAWFFFAYPPAAKETPNVNGTKITRTL